MSNKKLSFKLGQEKNRGELYTQHSNSKDNTIVALEDGQILFSYSGIDSTKYPYKSYAYDSTSNIKSSKDARIYMDLSNERIPISSYFSDYSSKLWDLSTGTEFSVGNSFNSIYFNNGQPNRGHGNNIIYCECLDSNVESDSPIRISLSNGTWLYDENSSFKNEIPVGTIFIIYFSFGVVHGVKNYLQLKFSENSDDRQSIIRAYNLSENYNIPEGTFISYVYSSGYLYQINDPMATTENYGQTKLYDNFDSTATNLAATANSIHKIVNESLTFTGDKTFKGKTIFNDIVDFDTSIVMKGINILMPNKDHANYPVLQNYANGGQNNIALNSNGDGLYLGFINTNNIYFGPNSNRWAIFGSSLIRFNKTLNLISNDITDTNEGGSLRIGPSTITDDSSLLFDNDGIQARYGNGNPAILNLNPNGGGIQLGPNSCLYIGYGSSSDELDIAGMIVTNGKIDCGGFIESKSIFPKSHNQSSIGKNNSRWKNIYACNYIQTGALVVGNTGESDGTNTKTIGYGTDTPNTIINTPTKGQVYFQIIN